jgi:predicted nucleic acid-binding protein
MKGSSYDTRFLVEMYYSADERALEKIRQILLGSKPNYLSTIALSEIYRLTLQKEGRTIADLRSTSLEKDFRMVSVDARIAKEAAAIKNRKNIPFADSLIASTAKILKVPCYTDDQHFESIDGVNLRWI